MAQIKTLDAAGIKTLAQIMAQKDASTLAEAKQHVATTLADYAKTSEVQTAISGIKNEVKAEIIGGAPEDYDTLKEIADYIETHGSEASALNSAIAKKANAEDVYTQEQVDEKLEGCLTSDDLAVFTTAEIAALVDEALA